MKITPEHFRVLENAIKGVNPAQFVRQYENGNFPRPENVKDLQMRFCFDMYYKSGVSSEFCGLGYKDDHLYTALKKLCPKVTRRY